MRTLVAIALLIVLSGCGMFSVQSPIVATSPIQGARDATKATVDFLCPDAVMPDPRGSFASGFFTRFMVNRTQTELSKQDLADIALFKTVCDKPIADRTDFDLGLLAGGTMDRIVTMSLPLLGKDFFGLMNALGLVLK
jgi:hypothetical protein